MVVELRSVPMRVDEHLVDLDDVDAELEHVGQAAVAGADVVDRDAHAEALQGGDDAAGLGQVLDRIALGHFQHDLRQIESASRRKYRARP